MASTQRKCHYEVLEVDPESDAATIKAQYYKLARTWHPDKNPDNPEEATLKFKEIQAAYEVLSDPQERAWYDSHKHQILRGDNNQEDTEYFGINLFPYFSRGCFKGFGDDPEGFYTVFSTVFKQVIEEEQKYTNAKTFYGYPTFGNSSSTPDFVKKFYQHWANFASAKTFAWCDMYKSTDAPNRQVRRIVDKENKKERDRARKEFNDIVRRLVATVRRQDPRVFQYEQKEAQEKKEKQERDLMEKQKRAKELQIARAKAREEEEREMEQEEELELNLDEHLSESDEKEENADFLCVACGKVFKTEKQWQNHERSKKHQQNMQKLKKEVTLDPETEKAINQAQKTANTNTTATDSATVAAATTTSTTTTNATTNTTTNTTTTTTSLTTTTTPTNTTTSTNNAEESQEEEEQEEEPIKGADEVVENEDENEDDDENAFLQRMINAKTKNNANTRNNKSGKAAQRKESSSEEEPETPATNTSATSTPPVDTATSTTNSTPQAKKKRRRRDKTNDQKSDNKNASTQTTAKPAHVCQTCGKNFDTRNSLFSHIQATKHAAPKQ